jgi:WD40 repeat protein
MSNDKSQQRWSGEWTTRTTGPAVRAIAVSANGSLVAAASDGGYGGNVRILSARSGALLLSYGGHAAPSGALAFCPLLESTLIATAGDDGSVEVWDAQSGQTRCCYYGHTGQVNALAWSPNGDLVASAGSDGRVHVWDSSWGRRVYCSAEHGQSVWDLAWSPDGATLASASREVALHWLDRSGGLLRREVLVRSTFGEVRRLGFSPTRPHLALTGPFPHVEVWRTEGESCALHERLACPDLLDHAVLWLAWAPDRAQALMLTLAPRPCPGGSALRLWGWGGGRPPRLVQRPVLDDLDGVSAAAWLDRRTIVVGTAAGLLHARCLDGIGQAAA